MRIINAITDYKGNFGSKWNARPYRSGLDKQYLSELFAKEGYNLTFIKPGDVDSEKDWKGSLVLYTSSEEAGLHYKSFIEDIVYSLKMKGAVLLPSYEFLRANNNKVFMELMRITALPAELRTITSKVYGSLEELKADAETNDFAYPCVIKKVAGAMSRGVFLAKSKKELIGHARNISRSGSVASSVKEKVRLTKHKGYQPESAHQHKFIIQPLIPGLTHDWKVLIYAEKYFILKRNIKDNDFRASGSGLNYTSGSESGFPLEKLDFIREFFKSLNVPHLSIDFAYDGDKGYVLEFQGIHFGTSTQYKSKDYYDWEKGSWILKNNDLDQEQVYVHSIVEHIRKITASS